MAAHTDLLTRFQPVLRYDSNEQFFADSAAQYTVTPGCELRRKRTATGNGAVIARAEPTAGEPALALDFLGPKTYGDGREVLEGDVIGLTGKDYREQYRRLRTAHPQLNNVVYGHAIEANGRLWLQYWLWYFYNDYQLSFSVGKHEGDWELVQLRMDAAAGRPDVAVYAQHRYGELRRWEQVERLGDRPVVYVARGSHASYFEAGFHQTEAWYDLADGKRRAKRRPKLEILGTEEPAWPRWPGRWGDTLPRSALESNSPTGPGAKKQWRSPDRMLDNPPAVSEHGGAGPRAPQIRALRAGGRLRVEYDVTARHPRPHTLVVTVNSVDEGAPPQTHTIPVHSGGHGKVTTEIVLDPLKRYDVHTSTIAGDPPVPSQTTRSDIPAFGEQAAAMTLGQRALKALSRAFAFIRGDRRG
ncbi:MAG: Vps62-related protein [Solirubrobacteraceae bacterium]|nr:Vps62-related protein [Solirubrobacteraceae bacterium]